MTVILAFSADQVAELTGLSKSQLRYWDNTDFFRPSIKNEVGKPFGRVYSFRDVVSLRVLSLLRNTHFVSLQELRNVGHWLATQPETTWANGKFFVAGRRVYFYDPAHDVVRQGSRTPQTVVPVEMHTIVADTERRAEKLRTRAPEEIGQIVQIRNVSHNYPVIAGTRIRTNAIIRFHEAGYSTDEIINEYPRLSAEDVDAAIEFEKRQRQAAS
jgi:uncharacterized protein (DUF433 family)